MNTIENRVVSNINSLIMMLVSKGIKQISLPKLALFINREFGIQMDDNQLSEILTKNSSVASVDGNVITFGQGEEQEQIDDDIHDTAVDQAAENLTSESFDVSKYGKFDNIKIGNVIESKSIKLNETDKEYFKHLGALKANADYIVTEICPRKNLNESFIRCKIDGQAIFIDIPLKSL